MYGASDMKEDMKEADTYAASKKSLLMYGYTDTRGRKLTKADVNTMNP